MKEELLIERKFGKLQMFKIPNGYFESFVPRMMDRLPFAVISKHLVKRKLRPVAWIACAAAVLAMAMICLGGFFKYTDNHVANVYQVKISQQAANDFFIEELSDYTMMDNDDFYSFMADE